MARLLPPEEGSLLLPDRDSFDSYDAYAEAEQDMFDDLLEQSRDIDPDSDADLTGAMCRWQRADGYAWYRVENTNPLTLCHVPYLDGYRVETALIRGLRPEDVRNNLRRQKPLSERL